MIGSDGRPAPSAAAKTIEEMVRSGVEEHFGLAEAVEVEIEAIEPAADDP
jgi:hypothetical protein